MPTTSVRRRISFLSHSWGLFGQSGHQICLRERGERQQVGPKGFKVIGDLGKLVGKRVYDPIILSSNGSSVGLIAHRVQQGAYPRPG